MLRKTKKITSWLLCFAMLLSLFAGMFPTALAAEPGTVPTQISMSLGGGAEEGKTAMAFHWVTDTTVSSSQIVYGTDAAAVTAGTASSKAASFVTPDGTGLGEGFEPVHGFHVVLTDLEPGATYYYKVGAEDAYSDVYDFVARDMESLDPFSFLFIPDTQGMNPEQFAYTRQMYTYLQENESDAAFAIHTGDVVEDAQTSATWQYYFEAAQSLHSSMPFMMTPGNHDSTTHDPKQVQFRARFDSSSLRTPDGLSVDAEGTVYAFDYGNALFVCLNSYLDYDGETNDQDIQWEFLKEECENTSKAWKIVFYHEATYDPGYSHYQLKNEDGKRLTDAGVDLVLNGHEHAYARSTLLTTGTTHNAVGEVEVRQPGEAPTYVVGGSVYNYSYGQSAQDTSWNEVFVDLRTDPSSGNGGSIHAPGVYNKIDVTNNSLSFSAYYQAYGDLQGFQVIDSFTITKPDAEIAQPVGGGTAPDSVNFLFDSFEQEDGKFTARFNWMTDADITASELYYAKKSDFDSNGGKYTHYVLGRSELLDMRPMLEDAGYINIGANYSIEARQSHKAETGTLEPDTEYVYCVGDGYRNVSEPKVFTTPEADPDDGFGFVFFTDMQQGICDSYGDTYAAYKNAGNVILNRALKQHPETDFLLSGGDQINYAFDTWSWDAFFAANAEIFKEMPVYLSEGNHENEGDGSGAYGGGGGQGDWSSVDPTMRNLLAHYNPPQNGAAYYGGGEDGTERMTAGQDRKQLEAENYYFIYDDTLFLVMEYSDLSTSERIEAQQAWMKSVVKNNPTKWRVAVIHKSLFGYRMDHEQSREKGWPAAFDEAGVDLVLMGHDHIYVRTKPLVNDQTTGQNMGSGTTYVSGFSSNNDLRGSSEYPRNNDVDETAYVEAECLSGYSYIRIGEDGIYITTEGTDFTGEWKTCEESVLITDTPRTYDLANWEYPPVPEEEDSPVVSSAALSGIAMEGQALSVTYTPEAATVKYQWEISDNGTDGWTAIANATRSSYVVKSDDVGKYLRCTVSGTGMYLGAAATAASDRVTGMGGGGEAIEISSKEDFLALVDGFGTADYPMNGFYILTADIDLEGVECRPIGSSSTPFLGTFDGGGHEISNLAIQEDSEKVTGLFAYVGASGHIANVRLMDAEVHGYGVVGLLAGALTGTVENCYVTGTVTASSSYIGGLVGAMHAATIQNCVVDAIVRGSSYENGGLFGSNDYTVIPNGTQAALPDGNVIRNNLVLGEVGTETAQYVGGLWGEMAGSKGCANQILTGNMIRLTSLTAKKDLGRAYGYWSSSDVGNLVSEDYTNYYADDTILISDSSESAQDRPGDGAGGDWLPVFTELAAAEFGKQQTYAELGWDFENVWEWDDMQNMPVPRVIEVSAPGGQYATIVAVADAGGVLSPIGNIAVEKGESVTFTFGPKDQYFVLSQVLIDGVQNDAAMEAGVYTFDNVQTLHKIEVITEPSGLQPEGRAPSVLGTELTYNLADPEHMHINVDLGEGDAGVSSSSSDGYGFTSIKAYRGGEEVFDFDGCFWYPNKSMPHNNITLELCFDDMQKKPEYANLTPGTYEVVFLFSDPILTKYTVPMTVVGGGTGQPEPGESAYWTLSALERAEKASDVPADATTAAALYGLKDETVGYQIVVKAPADEDLEITGLTVSALSGPNGAVIADTQMDLYREHFIFVPAEHHTESYGGHNVFPTDDSWIADPLIPLVDPLTGEAPAGEASLTALPYTVSAGENAVFFVDVTIPGNARAGQYTGTYTLQCGEEEMSGDVTLTVWNYTMEYGTQYSQFGGTGTGASLDMLLRHGIGTSDGLDKEAFDRAARSGVQRFNEPGFWGDVSWGQRGQQMLDAPSAEEIEAAIEKLGFQVGDETLWVNYCIDEIESAYEEYIPDDWASWFDPQDYDESYEGDWQDFYEGSRDAFRHKLYDWHKALNAYGIQLEIVCRPYPDMLDDWDLWNEDHAEEIASGELEAKNPGEGEPIVDVFVSLDSLYFTDYLDSDGSVVLNEEGAPLTTAEMIRAAQEAGCEVWSYTAMVQDDYSPTWCLEAPLVDYRMLPGFLNQAMGFTGTLNWRVNYDMDNLSDDLQLTENVEYAWGGSLLDGTLAYSGAAAGLSGEQFVQSLRLKAIRSGFADYAYAQMLRDLGEGDFVDDVVARVAVDYGDWSDDPAEILNAKLALGEKLDSLGEEEADQPSQGGTTGRKDPEKVPEDTDHVFADVPSGAYYADAVAWAVANNVTTGTSDITFAPDAVCTRAQAVTFLWRASGAPAVESDAQFVDVPANAYYADAVAWAVSKGITNGTSADTFSPDAACTRAHVVTFLYRAAGCPEALESASFQDVSAGAYYADAVAWAVENGVTTGTGADTFAPGAFCTRAQIVTFLYRALAK